MQSAFINWRQEPNEYLEEILGKDRVYTLNPIKTYLQAGIVISLGSDAPCTSPNPIDWMNRAVNNPNREQAIGIQDALRMCTYNGYYASFDENSRGSLEVGKIADMVIVSQNPYRINTKDLGKLKVNKLILNGREYTQLKKSVITTIVDCLKSKDRNF